MTAAWLTLHCTCIVLGAWGLLNGAQWLAGAQTLRNGSALGWDLQRLRRGWLSRSELLAAIYDAPGLSIVAIVHMAASIVLIGLPLGNFSALVLICFLLTTLLLALRLGADGADKMIMVATTGALLQLLGLLAEAPLIFLAGALWVGGQLTIAYFAAGASKLRLEPWRSGAAPGAVLSSYMWGHRWTSDLAIRTVPMRVLAWAIMAAEIAFPLAVLLGGTWLWAALAVFLIFHLTIALVMGLNHYPLAFLAAYPSVLLIGRLPWSGLG